MFASSRRACWLLFSSTFGTHTAAITEANEDLPRRQYESGLSFLQGQRYAEALKDFQAIIDSFPKSLVADNALLQIALYQIDVAHDLGTARTVSNRPPP